MIQNNVFYILVLLLFPASFNIQPRVACTFITKFPDWFFHPVKAAAVAFPALHFKTCLDFLRLTRQRKVVVALNVCYIRYLDWFSQKQNKSDDCMLYVLQKTKTETWFQCRRGWLPITDTESQQKKSERPHMNKAWFA